MPHAWYSGVIAFKPEFPQNGFPHHRYAKLCVAVAVVLAITRLVVAQFSFFIPKSSSKDNPIVVQVLGIAILV